MDRKKILQLLATLAILACFSLPTHAADHGKNVTPVLSLLLFSGINYKEVTSATGRIWLDRNLGASRVATSSTDSDAYGDLYQWGRLTDGHENRTSSTTTDLSSTDIPGHGSFILVNGSILDWRTPQNDNLWQGVSGMNNPCPSDFRIPTATEFNDEQNSWNSKDSAGAFGSPLKLVMAGYRSLYGDFVIDEGATGSFWISTITNKNSFCFIFNSSNAYPIGSARGAGRSVRCIKD